MLTPTKLNKIVTTLCVFYYLDSYSLIVEWVSKFYLCYVVLHAALSWTAPNILTGTDSVADLWAMKVPADFLFYVPQGNPRIGDISGKNLIWTCTGITENARYALFSLLAALFSLSFDYRLSLRGKNRSGNRIGGSVLLAVLVQRFGILVLFVKPCGWLSELRKRKLLEFEITEISDSIPRSGHGLSRKLH